MPKAIQPRISARRKLCLTVQYASALATIPPRSDLRRWIYSALERDATITLRFVDAREGRALNRAFRNKDYATNVLTFIYSDAGSKNLVGDIVICAPVVAKEAREQKKVIAQHYAHLVTHAVLHLQGYDHENEYDATKMERREIEILARKGIANPYLL